VPGNRPKTKGRRQVHPGERRRGKKNSRGPGVNRGLSENRVGKRIKVHRDVANKWVKRKAIPQGQRSSGSEVTPKIAYGHWNPRRKKKSAQ